MTISINPLQRVTVTNFIWVNRVLFLNYRSYSHHPIFIRVLLTTYNTKCCSVIILMFICLHSLHLRNSTLNHQSLFLYCINPPRMCIFLSISIRNRAMVLWFLIQSGVLLYFVFVCFCFVFVFCFFGGGGLNVWGFFCINVIVSVIPC